MSKFAKITVELELINENNHLIFPATKFTTTIRVPDEATPFGLTERIHDQIKKEIGHVEPI
jgi:hypothetical protein